MKKALCVLLAILSVTALFSGCSKNDGGEPMPAESFRITSYAVGDTIVESFDASHISQVTDMILFGVATFDEEGKVTATENLEPALKLLRDGAEKSNPDMKIYINLLGPGNQSGSDDWNEQMNDLSQRHTNAFESGNLEKSILELVEKYDFDGVFFDYEFPLKSKYWKAYDKFLISLDSVLGDKYKIGIALADWNAKQSKEAIAVTDFVEVMAYDLWDDDGNHATMDIAAEAMEKMIKKGYSKKQLDLGLPFYARPTTKEAYWYDYASYYDKFDENGLYNDSETGLTFSFNDYELIAQKTEWALENGYGGMMIWHYSCDLSADNEKSLFNAIYNTKTDYIADKA